MKKNWLLTVRVNGLARKWLEQLLVIITAAVKNFGGTLTGGFEELPDEVSNDQKTH